MSIYQKYLCFALSVLASHEAMSMARRVTGQAGAQAGRALGAGVVSTAGRQFATTRPDLMRTTQPLYDNEKLDNFKNIKPAESQYFLREKIIFETPGDKSNTYTKRSLLYKAIDDLDVAEFNKALENGANPNELFTLQTGKKITPLDFLMNQIQGNFLEKDMILEMIKVLLKYGADVNAISSSSSHSPLIMALSSNDLELVKILLDHNARVLDTEDPLDIAIDRGDLGRPGVQNKDIISMLLDKNLQIKNSHLLSAVKSRQMDGVKALLNKGYTFTTDHLRQASIGNIPLLVASGVQDIPDEHGKTVLSSLYQRQKDLQEPNQYLQNAINSLEQQREMGLKQQWEKGGYGDKVQIFADRASSWWNQKK